MPSLKLSVTCISLTIATISAFGVIVPRITANTVTTKQIQTANNWLIQGLFKLKENNYQGALSNFTKAIKINNQYAQAYYYRGLIYAQYAQGKPLSPDGILPGCRKTDDYRTVCKLDLTSSWKDENRRKAIEDFTQAIKFNPQYAQAYYQRGLLQPEGSQKRKDSQRAVDLYLKNTLQYLKQGIPKQKLPTWTDIHESMEHPIGSSTESPQKSLDDLMNRADKSFRKGDWQTALIIYRQVGRMFRDNKEDKKYQEIQQIIQEIEQVTKK